MQGKDSAQESGKWESLGEQRKWQEKDKSPKRARCSPEFDGLHLVSAGHYGRDSHFVSTEYSIFHSPSQSRLLLSFSRQGASKMIASVTLDHEP
jgi:hypothetical protein